MTQTATQAPRTVCQEPVPKTMLREALDLVGCAGSIYFFFLAYGMFQEDIYVSKYGPNQEKFTYSTFLVLAQCLMNALVACVVILVKRPPANKTPMSSFAWVSLTYIGAMFASNYALNYISFPTQVLAKSCKMIPVMAMSVVINKKKYTWGQYICVLVITAGLAVFMLNKGSKKGKGGIESHPFGLVLCLISLVLDGFTGPSQEKMRRLYHTNQDHLMLYMNVFACLYLTAGMLLTGGLMPGLEFIQRNPDVLPKFAIFGACSAAGQYFIFVTLFRFNALILTIVTTTRKFFTILISIVWKKHVLNTSQWAGIFMVFAGLLLNIYQKYLLKRAKDAVTAAGGKEDKKTK